MISFYIKPGVIGSVVGPSQQGEDSSDPEDPEDSSNCSFSPHPSLALGLMGVWGTLVNVLVSGHSPNYVHGLCCDHFEDEINYLR